MKTKPDFDVGLVSFVDVWVEMSTLQVKGGAGAQKVRQSTTIFGHWQLH